MADYKSLKAYDEREIKEALSFMEDLGNSSASTKGNSSICSCSDCDEQYLQACCQFSSESCYSDECSCSDCMDSDQDCGGTTCALAPKWMAEGKAKAKSSRKKAKNSYCQGGVCPFVKKPKAKTKSKKISKKTPKKKPGPKKGKTSRCCCCSCR